MRAAASAPRGLTRRRRRLEVLGIREAVDAGACLEVELLEVAHRLELEVEGRRSSSAGVFARVLSAGEWAASK